MSVRDRYHGRHRRLMLRLVRCDQSRAKSMPPCVLAAVIILAVSPLCEGHGRLLDPPSRATMWRMGFDSPADYDDHQGYCGGKDALWKRFEGRCGVCGDPYYPTPRAHERGGRYYQGTPTKTYKSGGLITVTVGITANHRGWIEFRLCSYDYPRDGDFEYDSKGSFLEVTQKCLDRHLLTLEDGSSRYDLPEPYSSGEYSIKVRLPRGLVCKKCLFQWKWNAGNSWGTDPDGTSCIGCGEQEQFYACADIVIRPRDETILPEPKGKSGTRRTDTRNRKTRPIKGKGKKKGNKIKPRTDTKELDGDKRGTSTSTFPITTQATTTTQKHKKDELWWFIERVPVFFHSIVKEESSKNTSKENDDPKYVVTLTPKVTTTKEDTKNSRKLSPSFWKWMTSFNPLFSKSIPSNNNQGSKDNSANGQKNRGKSKMLDPLINGQTFDITLDQNSSSVTYKDQTQEAAILHSWWARLNAKLSNAFLHGLFVDRDEPPQEGEKMETIGKSFSEIENMKTRTRRGVDSRGTNLIESNSVKDVTFLANSENIDGASSTADRSSQKEQTKEPSFRSLHNMENNPRHETSSRNNFTSANWFKANGYTDMEKDCGNISNLLLPSTVTINTIINEWEHVQGNGNVSFENKQPSVLQQTKSSTDRKAASRAQNVVTPLQEIADSNLVIKDLIALRSPVNATETGNVNNRVENRNRSTGNSVIDSPLLASNSKTTQGDDERPEAHIESDESTSNDYEQSKLSQTQQSHASTHIAELRMTHTFERQVYKAGYESLHHENDTDYNNSTRGQYNSSLLASSLPAAEDAEQSQTASDLTAATDDKSLRHRDSSDRNDFIYHDSQVGKPPNNTNSTLSQKDKGEISPKSQRKSKKQKASKKSKIRRKGKNLGETLHRTVKSENGTVHESLLGATGKRTNITSSSGSRRIKVTRKKSTNRRASNSTVGNKKADNLHNLNKTSEDKNDPAIHRITSTIYLSNSSYSNNSNTNKDNATQKTEHEHNIQDRFPANLLHGKRMLLQNRMEHIMASLRARTNVRESSSESLTNREPDTSHKPVNSGRLLDHADFKLGNSGSLVNEDRNSASDDSNDEYGVKYVHESVKGGYDNYSHNRRFGHGSNTSGRGSDYALKGSISDHNTLSGHLNNHHVYNSSEGGRKSEDGSNNRGTGHGRGKIHSRGSTSKSDTIIHEDTHAGKSIHAVLREKGSGHKGRFDASKGGNEAGPTHGDIKKTNASMESIKSPHSEEKGSHKEVAQGNRGVSHGNAGDSVKSKIKDGQESSGNNGDAQGMDTGNTQGRHKHGTSSQGVKKHGEKPNQSHGGKDSDRGKTENGNKRLSSVKGLEDWEFHGEHTDHAGEPTDHAGEHGEDHGGGGSSKSDKKKKEFSGHEEGDKKDKNKEVEHVAGEDHKTTDEGHDEEDETHDNEDDDHEHKQEKHEDHKEDSTNGDDENDSTSGKDCKKNKGHKDEKDENHGDIEEEDHEGDTEENNEDHGKSDHDDLHGDGEHVGGDHKENEHCSCHHKDSGHGESYEEHAHSGGGHEENGESGHGKEEHGDEKTGHTDEEASHDDEDNESEGHSESGHGVEEEDHGGKKEEGKGNEEHGEEDLSHFSEGSHEEGGHCGNDHGDTHYESGHGGGGHEESGHGDEHHDDTHKKSGRGHDDHGDTHEEGGHGEGGHEEGGHGGSDHEEGGHGDEHHDDTHKECGHGGGGHEESEHSGGGHEESGHGHDDHGDTHEEDGHSEGGHEEDGHGEGGHEEGGQGHDDHGDTHTEGGHGGGGHDASGHGGAGHDEGGHGGGDHGEGGHGGGGHEEDGHGGGGHDEDKHGHGDHGDTHEEDEHGGGGHEEGGHGGGGHDEDEHVHDDHGDTYEESGHGGGGHGGGGHKEGGHGGGGHEEGGHGGGGHEEGGHVGGGHEGGGHNREDHGDIHKIGGHGGSNQKGNTHNGVKHEEKKNKGKDGQFEQAKDENGKFKDSNNSVKAASNESKLEESNKSDHIRNEQGLWEWHGKKSRRKGDNRKLGLSQGGDLGDIMMSLMYNKVDSISYNNNNNLDNYNKENYDKSFKPGRGKENIKNNKEFNRYGYEKDLFEVKKNGGMGETYNSGEKQAFSSKTGQKSKFSLEQKITSYEYDESSSVARPPKGRGSSKHVQMPTYVDNGGWNTASYFKAASKENDGISEKRNSGKNVLDDSQKKRYATKNNVGTDNNEQQKKRYATKNNVGTDNNEQQKKRYATKNNVGTDNNEQKYVACGHPISNKEDAIETDDNSGESCDESNGSDSHDDSDFNDSKEHNKEYDESYDYSPDILLSGGLNSGQKIFVGSVDENNAGKSYIFSNGTSHGSDKEENRKKFVRSSGASINPSSEDNSGFSSKDYIFPFNKVDVGSRDYAYGNVENGYSKGVTSLSAGKGYNGFSAFKTTDVKLGSQSEGLLALIPERDRDKHIRMSESEPGAAQKTYGYLNNKNKVTETTFLRSDFQSVGKMYDKYMTASESTGGANQYDSKVKTADGDEYFKSKNYDGDEDLNPGKDYGDYKSADYGNVVSYGKNDGKSQKKVVSDKIGKAGEEVKTLSGVQNGEKENKNNPKKKYTETKAGKSGGTRNGDKEYRNSIDVGKAIGVSQDYSYDYTAQHDGGEALDVSRNDGKKSSSVTKGKITGGNDYSDIYKDYEGKVSYDSNIGKNVNVDEKGSNDGGGSGGKSDSAKNARAEGTSVSSETNGDKGKEESVSGKSNGDKVTSRRLQGKSSDKKGKNYNINSKTNGRKSNGEILSDKTNGDKGKEESVNGDKRNEENVSGDKGKEESVNGDKGKEESVNGDNGKEESVSGDNGKEESVSGDKGKVESVSGDNGKEESVNGDKGKEESVSGDKGKEESVSGDKGKEESVNGDKGKEDSVSREKGKEESVSGDKGKEESVSGDSGKEESVSGDKGKEESVSGDKGKEESVNGDKGKEDSVSREKGKEESVSGDKGKEESVSGDSGKEESVSGDKGKEENVSGDKGKDESVSGDKGKEESVSDDKGKDESVSGDNGKEKSVSDDKGEEERVTGENGKEKSVNSDKGKDEIVSGDKGKDESVRDDKGKDENAKADKGKEESVNGDNFKEEIVSGDKGKDESVRDDKGKDESANGDKGKEESVNGDNFKEEIVSGDKGKDESVRDDKGKDESASGDNGNEKNVNGDKGKEASVSGDSGEEETDSGDKSNEESLISNARGDTGNDVSISAKANDGKGKDKSVSSKASGDKGRDESVISKARGDKVKGKSLTGKTGGNKGNDESFSGKASGDNNKDESASSEEYSDSGKVKIGVSKANADNVNDEDSSDKSSDEGDKNGSVSLKASGDSLKASGDSLKASGDSLKASGDSFKNKGVKDKTSEGDKADFSDVSIDITDYSKDYSDGNKGVSDKDKSGSKVDKGNVKGDSKVNKGNVKGSKASDKESGAKGKLDEAKGDDKTTDSNNDIGDSSKASYSGGKVRDSGKVNGDTDKVDNRVNKAKSRGNNAENNDGKVAGGSKVNSDTFDAIKGNSNTFQDKRSKGNNKNNNKASKEIDDQDKDIVKKDDDPGFTDYGAGGRKDYGNDNEIINGYTTGNSKDSNSGSSKTDTSGKKITDYDSTLGNKEKVGNGKEETVTVNPYANVKSCTGVGVWEKIKGMGRWCYRNCRKGHCPRTHCKCI